jgi:transcriptional regulator with GAF, ATPase, and Fis domain
VTKKKPSSYPRSRPSSAPRKPPSIPRDDADLTQQTLFISDTQDFKFLRASRLVVVRGPDAGRELTIEKEQVTVGRSSICDLVLGDASISGIHCEVNADPVGHVIRDLGSTNGIFMLGHRVREVYLRPGTEFRLGNNLLRFEPLDTLVKIPLSTKEKFGPAHGKSVKMREIFAVLEKVATSNLALLLRGETGTGKELLASGVHSYSFRKNRAFMVLDCGAVPADIIESTLFGHEKGAFTGAERTHRGVFEEASGGTLFLDEIAELGLNLQPKLLRVLQQQEIQRVGGLKPISVDVRIVAATHQDLRAMVDKGLFREDLFYRLSVVEIVIPPLRERPEDIPLLADLFLIEGNQQRDQLNLGPVDFSDEAWAVLQSHSWPGNVRELRNVIERAIQLTEGNSIDRRDLQLDWLRDGKQRNLAVDCRLPYKEAKGRLTQQFERQYLMGLMQEFSGNLSAASRKAGLARHHLRNLCRRYGIPCGADS